jgi:hypothetical protein
VASVERGPAEEADEEVGVEAVWAEPDGRGVADDGAPPRLADSGASDDGAGRVVQAAEDLDE